MFTWEHFLRRCSQIGVESYLWIWESLSEETETSHCYFLFLEHGNIAKAQTLLTKATKCQYYHECTFPSFTEKLWAISVAAPVSRVPQKAEPEYIGKGQAWSHTKLLPSSSDGNFPVMWLALCIPDMMKSKDLGNFDPLSGLNMAGDQTGAKQQASLPLPLIDEPQNMPRFLATEESHKWWLLFLWVSMNSNKENSALTVKMPQCGNKILLHSLYATAESVRQWRLEAIKFSVVHLGKTSTHLNLLMRLDLWQISLFYFSPILSIITTDVSVDIVL